MPSTVPAPNSDPASWATSLFRIFAGTAVGALLGAAYGALVGGVHFATSGRWDSSPAFALTTAAVGAVLGLAGGCLLALASRRGSPQHTTSLPASRLPEWNRSATLFSSSLDGAPGAGRRLEEWSRNSPAPRSIGMPPAQEQPRLLPAGERPAVGEGAV